MNAFGLGREWYWTLLPTRKVSPVSKRMRRRPVRGLYYFYSRNLGLTPQALCRRPLRGL